MKDANTVLSMSFSFLTEHVELLVQLGDARRLDKVLGDQLDNVLGALNDEIWTSESA